jgi:two-component system response regulator
MNTRSILIVEDNAKDEMLALRVLKKSGLPIQAIVVRDGAEALDYLFCRGQPVADPGRELPAAVFLDLKLPKLNGLDVLREIRKHERTRHLPVVILTSSDDEGDILSGYQSGANSYVRKPVAYDDFDSTLVKLSEYWGVLNESPRSVGRMPDYPG